MFRKPEELIMAVLGALWIVTTYFLAQYATQDSTQYALMITGFTALWAIVSFVFWKNERWIPVWPILLGALVACWWPWLDWFALKDIAPVATHSMVVMQKPWYAGWIFKGVLAILPMLGGYLLKFRAQRQRQLAGKY